MQPLAILWTMEYVVLKMAFKLHVFRVPYIRIFFYFKKNNIVGEMWAWLASKYCFVFACAPMLWEVKSTPHLYFNFGFSKSNSNSFCKFYTLIMVFLCWFKLKYFEIIACLSSDIHASLPLFAASPWTLGGDLAACKYELPWLLPPNTCCASVM